LTALNMHLSVMHIQGNRSPTQIEQILPAKRRFSAEFLSRRKEHKEQLCVFFRSGAAPFEKEVPVTEPALPSHLRKIQTERRVAKMTRMDIRHVRAALAVVRESEALVVHLRGSISSGSSGHGLIGDGLDGYLKTTKKTLQIQLVVGYPKIVSGWLSKVTVMILRGWWSRITRRLQSMT
jgi:hypothetical protein